MSKPLGLLQVVGHPRFLQKDFGGVSVPTLFLGWCLRRENPYSLERPGSTQVPVGPHILTVSPLISSWHRSLARFMPRLAKLLEILSFLHFHCLGPQ